MKKTNLFIITALMVLFPAMTTLLNSCTPDVQATESNNVDIQLPDDFGSSQIGDNLYVSDHSFKGQEETIVLSRVSNDKIINSKITEQGNFSVIYTQARDTFALDYITSAQLDSLINTLN